MEMEIGSLLKFVVYLLIWINVWSWVYPGLCNVGLRVECLSSGKKFCIWVRRNVHTCETFATVTYRIQLLCRGNHGVLHPDQCWGLPTPWQCLVPGWHYWNSHRTHHPRLWNQVNTTPLSTNSISQTTTTEDRETLILKGERELKLYISLKCLCVLNLCLLHTFVDVSLFTIILVVLLYDCFQGLWRVM